MLFQYGLDNKNNVVFLSRCFMNTTSEDKDKIIAVQEELIRNLQKQIKEWEDWKASSKDRHAKGKTKRKPKK